MKGTKVAEWFMMFGLALIALSIIIKAIAG
jgi:hypothetical protein